MRSLYTSRRAFVGGALAVGAASALPWQALAQAAPSNAAPSGNPFAPADLAHAALVRDQALRSNLAFNLMASLVNEAGPRAAGSPGYDKAVQWALAKLKAFGFSNVRAQPLPLKMWQRGSLSARIAGNAPRELVAVALGNSVGTGEAGVEGEIAYYPSHEALKADTSDRAKSRVVFIDKKLERVRTTESYGAAIGGRVGGAIEAGRRGALAVAIRSLGTDADRIAHTGSMRYDPQVAKVPAIAVSTTDADWIAERAARNEPLRMRIAMATSPHLDALANNVIAELPGTDLANEIVLIGAHLDSWDITPGAQDDAAGVGIAIAAAKALMEAGRPPRRTVRVVLFANEENGFDGAKAYGERYKDEPHQLLGESDLGAGGVWRVRSAVAPAAVPAVQAMAKVLEPLGIPYEGNEGSPEPDIAVLSERHGWPALELSQDASNYFDIHHTVADTIDRVDPRTMPQNVAAWAAMGWLAAQKQGGFGPLAVSR